MDPAVAEFFRQLDHPLRPGFEAVPYFATPKPCK